MLLKETPGLCDVAWCEADLLFFSNNNMFQSVVFLLYYSNMPIYYWMAHDNF